MRGKAIVTAVDVSRRDLIVTLSVSAAALPLAGAAAVAAPGDRDSLIAAVDALARSAYPHPKLGAKFYREKSEAYLASADATTLEGLREGLARLDAQAAGNWAGLSPDARATALSKVQGEPFFRAFLGRMAELVYRDHRVWALVGYEGSSVEYGGYLERGFDDIDWLP